MRPSRARRSGKKSAVMRRFLSRSSRRAPRSRQLAQSNVVLLRSTQSMLHVRHPIIFSRGNSNQGDDEMTRGSHQHNGRRRIGAPNTGKNIDMVRIHEFVEFKGAVTRYFGDLDRKIDKVHIIFMSCRYWS